MTKQELTDKIEELKKQHNLKLTELYRQFAFSNNQVKIGDIIEDDYEKIEVKEIKFMCPCYYEKVSSCVYYGFLLTVKNQRFKNNKIATIYQTNLKTINGVEVK